MQSRNQFFDDIAKMTSEGMSFAHGMNQEIQNFFLSQAERAGQAMGFVSQEQFDSLSAICEKQATNIQALTQLCGLLSERLAELERHHNQGSEQQKNEIHTPQQPVRAVKTEIDSNDEEFVTP